MRTPKDENGQFDFENIQALDRKRLSADLRMLIRGEEVQLPRYNFLNGMSEAGDVIQLKKVRWSYWKASTV